MTGFVIMGVSGCGKSTIGAAFAAAIGARFVDGDDLHPAANVAKMRAGVALTDADRAPWLDRVGATLRQDQGVVACSALKRSYRDQIRTWAPVTFLYLQGTRATLLARLSARAGHFMPVNLLESQLAILQPPTSDELHLVQLIEQTPSQIVAGFLADLAKGRA